MKKFYVFDTTINPIRYVFFSTVEEVVAYLEGFVQRALKKTRAEFMHEMEELGHGYDDLQGVNFTRLLGDHVNIGVNQKGRPVKCDIHMLSNFSKLEYGQ